jgi:hypothetical protein
MTGTGRGMVTQMPLTAINDLLRADDFASAIAIPVFCQYFGGALLLSLGQTVFLGQLGLALQRFAPNVRAEDLINAGATNVRTIVPAVELNGVILAYNRALTQRSLRLTSIQYLTIAASCHRIPDELWTRGKRWRKTRKIGLRYEHAAAPSLIFH